MMRWNVFGWAFALILLVGATAHAQIVGMPHTFWPGVPPAAYELNENFGYVGPRNVVFVNPDPSGPIASGAALLAAVDPGQLAAIGGAPAGDNPYLIVIRPGVYHLKDTTLMLPPHVHLLGSGIGVTRIESLSDHAIVGEHDSSIRSLSIYHKGTQVQMSVYLLSGSGQLPFTIQGVEIQVHSDDEAYAVLARGGGKVYLRGVRFNVVGGKLARGVQAEEEVGVDAHDADIRVQSEEGVAEAIHIDTKEWSRSVFVTSVLSASSRGKRYPIATGPNFEGTVRIHASTLSGSKVFARVDGKGRLLVGTSEMGGQFYDALGATVVECVHIFDHNFADLLRCHSTP